MYFPIKRIGYIKLIENVFSNKKGLEIKYIGYI